MRKQIGEPRGARRRQRRQRKGLIADPVEFADTGLRFPDAAFADQPARRLRHDDGGQNGKDDRQEADRGKPAPADQRQQVARRNRGRQHAKGDGNDHETRDQRPVAGWSEFDDRRHRSRGTGREAKTHEEAQASEKDPAVFRYNGNRAGTEPADQHTGNGQRFPPEAIGEEARSQRAQHGADAGAHQHDRGLPEGQMPFRRQHRHQKADHEEIKEIDHAGHGKKDDR